MAIGGQLPRLGGPGDQTASEVSGLHPILSHHSISHFQLPLPRGWPFGLAIGGEASAQHNFPVRASPGLRNGSEIIQSSIRHLPSGRLVGRLPCHALRVTYLPSHVLPIQAPKVLLCLDLRTMLLTSMLELPSELLSYDNLLTSTEQGLQTGRPASANLSAPATQVREKVRFSHQMQSSGRCSTPAKRQFYQARFSGN